jgi:uncharacterized membrane protein
MGKYVLAYFAAAVVFLGMDFTWLTVMGQRLYAAELPGLMASKPALAPAILFYVAYLSGVVYFCIAPALKAGDWRRAALNGAVLGLCAYATYDLTNQATLRIWSTEVTVFDLVWGMFVTAVSATVGFWATWRAIHARGGPSPENRSAT